jgi:hypothetical protein
MHCWSEPSATPGAEGEVADVGVRSESGHEELDAESCLWHKPIPLELFLREIRTRLFLFMILTIFDLRA